MARRTVNIDKLDDTDEALLLEAAEAILGALTRREHQRWEREIDAGQPRFEAIAKQRYESLREALRLVKELPST